LSLLDRPAVDQSSPEQILQAELGLPAALDEEVGDMIGVQVSVLTDGQQDG
jgi:hypothetical protein